MLWNGFAVLQSEKRSWRSQSSTRIDHRIEEVKHLGSENRAMAANEDQHLAWCHDSLLAAAAPLLGRFQPQHLVWSHQRPLNMIPVGVDVRHYGKKPRAAKVIARLLY